MLANQRERNNSRKENKSATLWHIRNMERKKPSVRYASDVFRKATKECVVLHDSHAIVQFSQKLI